MSSISRYPIPQEWRTGSKSGGGRGAQTFDCMPTAHLGGSGGMLPRIFWKFRLSESVSDAIWQQFLD